MTEPLLTMNDLSVTFYKGRQAIKAVDQINFTINAGTTVGLVGESGSGKTTTGRAIAGIGPISGGDVLFGGQSIRHFSHAARKDFRRQVQMVFQDPFESLNPRQKVVDIIAEGIDNFHLATSREARLAQVLRLLTQVGLPADAINRFPHEFSGGQRQRIGIARALAVQPKFLVLDEPISALDVSIQAQIVNLLRQIQHEQHLTYLFIAHDLSMVHYISDKIVSCIKVASLRRAIQMQFITIRCILTRRRCCHRFRRLIQCLSSKNRCCTLTGRRLIRLPHWSKQHRRIGC